MKRFCLRTVIVFFCLKVFERGLEHTALTGVRVCLPPVSFLGVMCSRVLLNKTREEIMGECPLPAIKVSLDWLKLRPTVFTETAVDKRQ